MDALSHIPALPSLLSLTVPHALQLKEVESEVANDTNLRRIIVDLQQGQMTKSGYSLIQGRLFYKYKLVLPAKSTLIPLVLHECHDSPIGGHSGVLKTLKRALASLYWEGMKRDVQNYVARCSLASFGQNYSGCKAQLSSSAPPITHKPMVKHRSLIGVWKLTYVVLCTKNQNPGGDFCHGKSTGIILLSI